MKTKTVLVTLFLFAFGASLSEAVVNEVRRPSFFYGPPPYEFGYSQPEEQLRPTYMPREFGIRPEEQAIITPAPELAPFVPTPPEIEVAAAPEPEPEPRFLPKARPKQIQTDLSRLNTPEQDTQTTYRRQFLPGWKPPPRRVQPKLRPRLPSRQVPMKQKIPQTDLCRTNTPGEDSPIRNKKLGEAKRLLL